MGSRGKLPSDATLLKLRGTSRNAILETADGEFSPMSAEPPKGLDGVALETWRTMVPGLITDGTLRTVDRDIVTAYCHTFAQVTRLREIIRSEGDVIRGRGGIAKSHPANGMLRRAENMLLQLSREMGATPASRGRVQRHPPSEVQTGGIANLVRVGK